MIVRYTGTDTLASVEVRPGYKTTVYRGDILDIDPATGLLDDYSSLFEPVTYATNVMQKRTQLTPTQVKALNTTPITLVSAPGA